MQSGYRYGSVCHLIRRSSSGGIETADRYDFSNVTREEVAAILGWTLHDHEDLPKFIDGAIKPGSPLNKIVDFITHNKVERTAKGYTVWPRTETNYNVTPRKLTFDLRGSCQQYKKHQWCIHQYMVYVFRVLVSLRGHGFRIVRKGPEMEVYVHTNPDPSAEHEHAIVWSPREERWVCSCKWMRFHPLESCSHVTEFFAIMDYHRMAREAPFKVIGDHEDEGYLRIDLSHITDKWSREAGMA